MTINYGLIAEMLKDYPADAPVFAEYPLLDVPSDLGHFTVAKVRRHAAAMPKDDQPVIPHPERGPHLIAGIMFGAEAPVFILVPCEK
jgi:hypothetical protein